MPIAPELEMPADLEEEETEEAPKKNKGGRPRKNPPRAPESEPIEEPDDEKPKLKREPKPFWRKHWSFLHIGDVVWWYDVGTRENQPYPAIIMRKHKSSETFDLRIYSHDMDRVFRHIDGARHIDDPDYLDIQKKDIGAWEPKPSSKVLMDLVNDARRN